MLIVSAMNRAARPLLLATVLAVIWTYLTRDMYDYNMGFATVVSLNLFPLIAWVIALTVGYLFVEFLLAKFDLQRVWSKLLFVIMLYVIAVIILETLGYHIFGIHNLGTSSYAGLPFCDCLHAPTWMQAGYFLLGPLHWLMTKLLYRFSRAQAVKSV